MKFRHLVGSVLLLLWSTDSLALSCMRPSEQEVVEENENIFKIVFTDSTFYPEDDTYEKGTVIAHFKVLSVIKGNPDNVPYVEAKMTGLDQSWPGIIPVGRHYILATGDGPAYWSACSGLFPVLPERSNNCPEYLLRRFAGHKLEEDRFCESEFLWQGFKRKHMEPVSGRRDLEGLRAEWAALFGTVP